MTIDIDVTDYCSLLGIIIAGAKKDIMFYAKYRNDKKYKKYSMLFRETALEQFRLYKKIKGGCHV